ncbi:GNAT family N-acetyltransferase [Flavobacterium capsici]|uniref:GNAT family N-acetyltransferase n=1 Tax=Flavobacterium capsici TaxID=3075618 RepID=A0AA96F0N8_9FLAO|nr:MULTISPECIES: GNAT family N-acetyltransferase [unclassified Flavobacterium]WNM17926.1 GNAT family N-acetyltransferase [Flavobacterium sp. PMR2A8]WNM21978.1 GNAT family N-acetyltransferase [Flavobacterium sp. PMTSA4]
MEFITFETERLLLRPLELTDAEAMFAMDSNPDVHTYLWQKPSTDIAESIKVIEYVHRQYNQNNIGRFATILKETGEFIGWTGIKFVDDHIENGNTNFYDYGYRLNPKFWNKGYATEATQFWLTYGIDQLKVSDLNAYTHAQNGASNKVLGRCGMTFMEEYPDPEGVFWTWWQMKNTNQ